ncbi:LytTR family DNA-binding domain-containing protein [Chitinophaga sp. Cy-1792]|uniref:LytR/AlgR family response regulator transcription factor n=1 Tax=Chitinophaga sp. Cy-1792 TaxID=2608339 RepID=UPI0014237ED2|nr:LytTR family DNA-binding domain-containing protein [Chitinophaga sp. Cy-1792]NIG55533.1 response regulator transcription factor [Chitinophaga sp. Cy-1792]
MALKCIVVDDEPLAVQVLVSFIKKLPELELLHSFNNPMDALAFMKTAEVDLVFLDIQMPELSGIEFMQILQKNAEVIIVSAYDDYAIEGFEQDAIDYLLKPVSFERFLKAVQRAQSRKARPAAPLPPQDKYIFIRTDKRIVRLDVSEILFVEALRNYVAIQTPKQKIMTLQNLRSFEELLGNRFVRVHKSYIVALDKIDSIERQRIFIGTHNIPIGEAYTKHFMDALTFPK